MNIRTATVAELTTLKGRGAKWLCVAHYAHNGYEKGDILSWHRTPQAAARSAKGPFRAIEELVYVLENAAGYEFMMRASA